MFTHAFCPTEDDTNQVDILDNNVRLSCPVSIDQKQVNTRHRHVILSMAKTSFKDKTW